MSQLAFIAGAAFFMSALGVLGALILLRSSRVFDLPGARSNHSRPTPVGGGMGVVPVLLLCLYVLPSLTSSVEAVTVEVLLAMALLLVVSFADDVKGLPVRLRLAAQAAAVLLALAGYWHGALAAYGDLSRLALAVVIAGSLVWFINLYNFMDGIDGITGVETMSLGLGLFLVAGPSALGFAGLVTACAAAGFLLFNWQPARIFMGDCGSIPLGLLLGVLLWQLAAWNVAAALILPAYYLLDSTVTLLRRVWNRERIFEAHSRHFYQQAVRAGWPHRRVAAAVGVLNACLIGLAMLCGRYGMAADAALVLAAYGLSALTLWGFSSVRRADDTPLV